MRFTVGVLFASMGSMAVDMSQQDCDMEVEACNKLTTLFPSAAPRVEQYGVLAAAAQDCANAGGEYCYLTFQGGLVLEAGVNCANEAGYSILEDPLEGWSVDPTVGTSVSFVECATSKAVFISETSTTDFCANPGNGNRVEATINDNNIVLPEGSYPAAALVIDGCGSVAKNYQFTLTLNRAFGTPAPIIATSTREIVGEEGEASSNSADSTDSPASEGSVTSEGTTTSNGEITAAPAAAKGLLAASLVTGVIIVLGNL